MIKKLLLPAMMLVLFPGAVMADGPINLALVPSSQIVGETESVSVMRRMLMSGGIGFIRMSQDTECWARPWRA